MVVSVIDIAPVFRVNPAKFPQDYSRRLNYRNIYIYTYIGKNIHIGNKITISFFPSVAVFFYPFFYNSVRSCTRLNEKIHMRGYYTHQVTTVSMYICSTVLTVLNQSGPISYRAVRHGEQCFGSPNLQDSQLPGS